MKSEDILQKFAVKNMDSWNIDSFKKNYPTLFNTIIQSLDFVRDESINPIRESTIMDEEEIEDVVSDIMIKDGPDGHSDGSQIIANFITSLLSGSGEDWAKNYRNRKGIGKF